MHEMALTQDFVELISERCSGRRVTRVVLEVGELAAVLPSCACGSEDLEILAGDELKLKAVEVI